MKWVKNTIHKLFKWVFSLWAKLNTKNSVSFNPSISISAMPSPMPNINTFYEVATDTAVFEVLETDVRNNTVTIREVGTDIEYKIHAELFIMLFVLKEPDTTIRF